jgi:hypothetical protein
MAGELTPKAQEALNEIQLMQGEEVVYAVQADGFFLGANPIVKLIATWQALITKLTGGHIRVFLILTNMRLIMIESQAAMCGCNRNRGVNVISTRDLTEAGSAKATAMCFIHTRVVHVQSHTQTYTLAVKKLRDEDLRAFVTNMSQLIIANSQA